MWKYLVKINKNLVFAIPVAMAAGFLLGLAFNLNPLKIMIMPMTFLMVYPMMIGLNIKSLFSGHDYKTQLLTQGLNFALIPFIAYFLGQMFFFDKPYLALGLLLASLLPTSGMTISWTGFAKGNLAAAVKMTVLGLTLGSIATPIYIKWLMGTSIEMNIIYISKQIALIVFLPMVFGYLTRRALAKKFNEKEFKELVTPKLSSISTIGVLAIVFIAISLKAQSLVDSPRALLIILPPLLILYSINYFVSSLVGKFFLPRGDAIALVYGTVMRNLSIALAIAINSFGVYGSDVALVIALSYIIQVQSAAWYVKLTTKIFGPPSERI